MNAETMTMASIARDVASRHRITVADLRAGGRIRAYAWPRQEAMHLMCVTGRWSLPQIGQYFNGMHHTSVLYAARAYSHRALGADAPKRYPRHADLRCEKKAARLNNNIESLKGDRDGIRWGVIAVEGVRRSFFHDRIAGTVRLHSKKEGSDIYDYDLDPERLALAKAMLDAAWAMERRG